MPSSREPTAPECHAGEVFPASGGCPIDLDHLARQTMRDADLQREILGMFAQQIAEVREIMMTVRGAERVRLLHTLKGSARSVGAFAIGDYAAALEVDAEGDAPLDRLLTLMIEAQDFIATYRR